MYTQEDVSQASQQTIFLIIAWAKIIDVAKYNWRFHKLIPIWLFILFSYTHPLQRQILFCYYQYHEEQLLTNVINVG